MSANGLGWDGALYLSMTGNNDSVSGSLTGLLDGSRAGAMSAFCSVNLKVGSKPRRITGTLCGNPVNRVY